MHWNAIVAGVDRSPEGAWAGSTAWELAQATGAVCHLIHAVPDDLIPGGFIKDMPTLLEESCRLTQQSMAQWLAGNVPAGAISTLSVEPGRTTSSVLANVVHRTRADLLVLGAKHHRKSARWLGGSTAHNAIRIIDVPVLIATATTASITRIIAAVDLSRGARHTFAMAQRLAEDLGAELKVVHVVEGIMASAGLPEATAEVSLVEVANRVLEERLWPSVKEAGAKAEVLEGRAHEVLESEVASWKADLLVVGTHSKGWLDRAILGSVTHHLLSDLPTSLLVVPPHARAARPKETRDERWSVAV